MLLNQEQQTRAIEVMHAYLSAPKGPAGVTPAEASAERDRQRAELIEGELMPLVDSYLGDQLPLEEFKQKVDGINKRNEHWGFKGIKGQMFFNMVVNVAGDLGECDQEIKAAIAVPTSEDMARSRIKTFASYVRRIGEEHVEAGGTKQSRPKPGSIPFFLSYFWQLQDRNTWPVYYTNDVNTMSDLNLWVPSDDLAANYIDFKTIHEELAELFTERGNRHFGLYDVEHVFWFKGGNPYGGSKPLPKEQLETVGTEPDDVNESTRLDRLPESYVPPVIAVLPQIAQNEDGFEDLAKASGTSLPRALEKSVHAAFTILGYDAKLLGQGGGRVPDGVAIDHDNSYAIIWDAKVRGDCYSMGTDDRTIKEYIVSQSRELKRRRSIRNVYYVVLSSEFSDDFDEAIRSMKMETEISEVCLIEAAALVAIVDAKLRDPLQVSLGPDGVQRLFSCSGIVNAETVMQNLTG